MTKDEKHIVAKAYFLVANKGKLLVHKVLTNSKGEEDLVRPPGGHIEYGEYSIDTVKREAREEMKMSLTKPKLLGSFENIFKDPKGSLYHEIIFVYKAGLNNKAAYKQEAIHCEELDGRKFDMFWVPIKNIKNGEIKLVPKGIGVFLSSLAK